MRKVHYSLLLGLVLGFWSCTSDFDSSSDLLVEQNSTQIQDNQDPDASYDILEEIRIQELEAMAEAESQQDEISQKANLNCLQSDGTAKIKVRIPFASTDWDYFMVSYKDANSNGGFNKHINIARGTTYSSINTKVWSGNRTTIRVVPFCQGNSYKNWGYRKLIFPYIPNDCSVSSVANYSFVPSSSNNYAGKCN